MRESEAILQCLVDKYDSTRKISVSGIEEKYTQLRWVFFQSSGPDYGADRILRSWYKKLVARPAVKKVREVRTAMQKSNIAKRCIFYCAYGYNISSRTIRLVWAGIPDATTLIPHWMSRSDIR